MAWYVPLIIEGVKMIASNNANKGPARYKRTNEEQQYVDRLEKKSRYGAIDTGEVIRTTGREIQAQASDQKQDIIGRGISSGNMSSIITEELFRGVDKSVRDQINESSRQIALKNEETKLQAQDSLDQFLLSESSSVRSNKAARRQHKQDKQMQLIGNLGDMAQTGYQSYNAPGGPGYEKSLTATRKDGSGKHANYYNVRGGAGYYLPGGAGHDEKSKEYKPFAKQSIQNFINSGANTTGYFDDVKNYKSILYNIDSSFAKTIDWDSANQEELLRIVKQHVNNYIDTGNSQGSWGIPRIQ